MNITFLLGNGFDIGLGLKTRYKDFYNVYKTIKIDDNENIKNFKKIFQEKNEQINDWADFEKAFGEHSIEFKEGEEDLYLARFIDFLESFNIYLEEESLLIDYSNINYIGETMLKGVTEYFYIREGAKEEILKKYYGTERIYNFITFNYTDSVDKCVDALKDLLKNNNKDRSVGEVIHLHGYIERNMILGVNDESQIKNESFASNQQVSNILVKPKQNSILKTTYDTKTKAVIDKSDIICVYGMSLGETDKDWWNYISNWLSKSNGHVLVILAYNDKFNIKFPHTQQNLIVGLTEKFLSFSNLSTTSKDAIRDRIYIDFNHNVFEMKLCENYEENINRKSQVDVLKKINEIENIINENNIVEF